MLLIGTLRIQEKPISFNRVVQLKGWARFKFRGWSLNGQIFSRKYFALKCLEIWFGDVTAIVTRIH